MNVLNRNTIITVIATLLGLFLAYVLYTSLFADVADTEQAPMTAKVQAILPQGDNLNFKTVDEHGGSTNRFNYPKVDPNSVGITDYSTLIQPPAAQ